jgi:RNA polymerase sigma-70 factor (ECF subfamily)
MDPDTLRFVACIREQDRAALDALLGEHRQSCLLQANRIVGNAADAEDAVQDAFLRLVRTVDAYDGTVPFGAWLGQLVQAASRNARTAATRRRRREEVASTATDAAATTPADEERLALLRRMVDELPPELRTPIELRFFTGLSQKEAAERLGVSESALAVRVHRGKERLRRRLGQSGIVLGLIALEAQLADAASVPTPVAPGAPPAATATSLTVRLLGVVLALAIAITVVVWSAWSRRTSPGGSVRSPDQASPSAMGTVPQGGTAPGRPLRSYVWTFDDGPPPSRDFRILTGAWHHVPDRGLGGSGCMEVDSDFFVADIQGLTLDQALKVSVQFQPLGAPAAHSFGVSWKIDEADYYQCDLENVEHGPAGMVMDPDPEKRRYIRTLIYLGDDSLDNWFDSGRSHLCFLKRSPTLQVIIQGRQRIDDLRLDEVPPTAIPDVETYRRAVYAMPPELRHGVSDLPGLTGVDPHRPVRARWLQNSATAPVTRP